MQASQLKHIVALVLLLIFLGGVYYVATSVEFFSGSIDRAEKIQQITETLEEEVLVQQAQLSAIQLNTDFFDSPTYKSLDDTSVVLESPDLMRSDPFADL